MSSRLLWIPLWIVQYIVWVPLVLLAHAVGFALGIGMLGIVLLIIPIIGWIVLIFLLLGRSGHEPWVADLLRPWGPR
jgi:hypothetical protein